MRPHRYVCPQVHAMHGDDFKEVLEPVLDRVGAFLVQKLDVEDLWSRMSFKWIGLLASTCTTIHAARIPLFLSALEATGAAGDAQAISTILQQPWGEKTIIHEVGCKTLLSLLPALEETEGGALNDDDNEDEILRIACWEHGVSTVIHCLKVNSVCGSEECAWRENARAKRAFQHTQSNIVTK